MLNKWNRKPEPISLQLCIQQSFKIQPPAQEEQWETEAEENQYEKNERTVIIQYKNRQKEREYRRRCYGWSSRLRLGQEEEENQEDEESEDGEKEHKHRRWRSFLHQFQELHLQQLFLRQFRRIIPARIRRFPHSYVSSSSRKNRKQNPGQERWSFCL